MPVRDSRVGGFERFTLRHVGPRASVYPTTPAANIGVLNRSDMVSRRLPSSDLPTSPDVITGQYTLRLGDAGEIQATFPNTTGSDGTLWRKRFDPTGHLQWLEVYADGELEQVGVIDQVVPDGTQVQVHAYDPMWLLKKAYERDLIVVKAPRDVLQRASQLWTPTLVDAFPAGTLNSQWTAGTAAGGIVSLGAGGGLVLYVPAATGSAASVTSNAVATGTVNTWAATTTIIGQGTNAIPVASLIVKESTGDQYNVNVQGANVVFYLGTSVVAQVAATSAASYSLRIESDGEWVTGFCNGQYVGGIRRQHSTTTTLTTTLYLATSSPSLPGPYSATFSQVLVETQQPFLMSGTDGGDYVLPGSATTYPSGGLHGRYYNDLDLQGDSLRLQKILHPSRSQASGNSNPAEYANQLTTDNTGGSGAVIAGNNPQPGAATSCWSAKWFGSIYLRLSLGSYTITTGQLSSPVTTAIRVWVGNTAFGTQLIDNWTWGYPGYTNATISATTLAGNLSYGAGTVARDGWYPIIIEYAVDGTAGSGPNLLFTPPASYTDPGGTAITGGASQTIPSTSLSPLGCVDQRYQGIAHFDLYQQTLQAYDYQAAVEPQRLESGLFPGVLAPRIREGHDTDVILEPNTGPRQDGEGILNYSSTLDASDFCASLYGNGASVQTGAAQQQAVVYDPTTLENSLFDAQGWQDFSDAAFPSLLQGLLNTQLGLRLAPWQLLSADPLGRPRRAFTWPLPGTLTRMRWRPGDGLRIHARDINVWDTSPRQMLTITRNFAPLGRTGTTATYANRPRTAAHTLKQQLYAATRPLRNYQGQTSVAPSALVQTFTLTAGSTGGYAILTLGTLQIVRLLLVVTMPVGTGSFGVNVNGVDQTTALNGPWHFSPVTLDISQLSPDSANRFYAAAINKGSSSIGEIDVQLIAQVAH